MKLATMNDLFIHALRDLHSAEKQLIEALPKMERAAKSPELKQCFKDHLEETRGQLEQLEALMKEMSIGEGKTKCVAMAGIIKEGSEILETDGDPDVKDCGIIGAAKRVEHYEVAAYGATIDIAEALHLDQCVETLEAILDQEAEAIETLSAISHDLLKAASDERPAGSEPKAKRAKTKQA